MTPDTGSLPSTSPHPSPGRAHFLLTPTHCILQASPRASGDSVSPPSPSVGVLGLHDLMWFWPYEISTHACSVSTLPTDQSPPSF